MTHGVGDLPGADRLTHNVDAAGARPRVVFLARDLVMGGAERGFLTYVNSASGIEPVVALLRREGGLLRELRPEIPSFTLSDGFPTYGSVADVLDRIPAWTGVRMLHECRRLAAVVRDTRASVVSSFLMRSHIVALMTKRLFLADLRVVLNIHEHWTESAPYLYPNRRDQWMMRWITRHVFPDADRIVTVASEVRDDLVHRHGLSPDKLRVAFNPLQLDRIRDEARQPLSPALSEFLSVPTIVAVGRLVPLKGYDLLIRALAELRRTSDVRLMLVGDGDERPALERLTHTLGIADAVLFAGWQDNPWRIMARARLLALTSHTEAFPCVLCESLALGVPVLATDCTKGVRELLEDGACGLIVPSGDVAAIAQGLRRLLTDERMRTEFSQHGLRRVEAFAPATAIPRYEAILREVARIEGAVAVQAASISGTLE